MVKNRKIKITCLLCLCQFLVEIYLAHTTLRSRWYPSRLVWCCLLPGFPNWSVLKYALPQNPVHRSRSLLDPHAWVLSKERVSSEWFLRLSSSTIRDSWSLSLTPLCHCLINFFKAWSFCIELSSLSSCSLRISSSWVDGTRLAKETICADDGGRFACPCPLFAANRRAMDSYT